VPPRPRIFALIHFAFVGLGQCAHFRSFVLRPPRLSRIASDRGNLGAPVGAIIQSGMSSLSIRRSQFALA
jgi:hypothetical protein